ncbi:lytic murein transglycosylase B [Algiphilus sp.]|uniref:lytic murein transglycosylase B n=1 Tax=Algiphilus sp. TaxID=1872431 RepID=UPI0025BE4B07|nr:lytic murein transglycosylase B [Algiphilus sp.]MCK5769273.1 lytic murein transglycosylase B [Algiphilus sp.]
MIRIARVLVALAVAGCTVGAAAPAGSGYAEHARLPALLETLRDDYGFDATDLAVVRRTLADAERLPELIRQERNAPERTRTWSEYRGLHVTDSMVARGVAFMRDHAGTLARAEAEYGVPPELITAILGVETRYGGFVGTTRVLDALATQGFDHPTRSRFFLSELAAFFALTRETGMDPTEPVGSYAGAMGWAQFMPSNYRRLAVDFDGDGDTDLWSAADAIGSVARYLVAYDPDTAWRRGEPMVLAPREFRVRADATDFNTRSPNSSIGALAALGAKPTASVADTTPAGLLALQLDAGRAFRIALTNFYAVMRYNPRVYYAMAVGELAEGISRATDHAAGRFTP